MRFPKMIEAFCSKKIVDFAVGSFHCLAVTEDGELYSWGQNEQGQLGDTSCTARAEPTLISTIASKEITGVACGPAQVGVLYTDKYMYSTCTLRSAVILPKLMYVLWVT